jgi:mannose-6-phosphate isomerase-like protein (cupin superfamily)
MKKFLAAAAIALPFLLAQHSGAFGQSTAPPAVAAQQPPQPRPVQPGGPVPFSQGGIIAIREYPSNKQSGVDADRFIGYAATAPSRTWNGMTIRSMLRAGDPYTPGPQGNVLEYRDDLGVASLAPHAQSGTMASPDEIYFYFVQEGTGTIDTGPGSKPADIHSGVGILIAPGTKQHIVNAGATPLSMIAMSWKNNDGMKVVAPIKIVDTSKTPYNPPGAHWIMSSRGRLFDGKDGVNMTMSVIGIPAGTYSGPHAHWKGVEEIWVKTGSDTGYAILGSEIRKIDGAGAFLAPPNGLTTHASMNLNTDWSIWLYLSRRMPNGGGGERP